MNIPDLIQSYGYYAVAVGTFLEGETVLLLAGAAASSSHLAMPWVIAVATVASFAGDQLFFYLGRAYGPALLQRRTIRSWCLQAARCCSSAISR